MFFTLFNTRTRNTTQLIRVWRATGNPRTPLTAIWLTPAQAAALRSNDTATEEALRRCA